MTQPGSKPPSPRSLANTLLISPMVQFNTDMWSYASHIAQCGVTTSHCTCGYCVRAYHISFRLFALSNSSVSTQCLKDPVEWGNPIQPDLHLTVRLYEWLDCLDTQRIEKTRCLTKTKNRFY